jgi:hypothetical protein
MASAVEIGRALAAVTAMMNDQELDELDTDRIQQIINAAAGQPGLLTVDDGGGLHQQSGARVGALRRTDSGEWIADRQNEQAERSESAVPAPPPQGRFRSFLTSLKVRG